MPFKIVETIEKGRRLIETVPSQWEKDGYLYWPTKNVTSLKKKEESAPLSDWKTLPCILIRDNISDYKTAREKMALMSDASATDTEDKENNYPRKKPPVEMDLNNLAESIKQSKMPEAASPMMAAEDTSSVVAVKNSSSIPAAGDTPSATLIDTLTTHESHVVNVIIEDYAQEETVATTEIPEIPEIPEIRSYLKDYLKDDLDPHTTDPKTTVNSQFPEQNQLIVDMLTAIQTNQKLLFDNQQSILKVLATMDTKMEEYFTRSIAPRNQHEDHTSKFQTIKNIKQLKDFEDQLKNPVMEMKYLGDLSVYCSEKKTGQNNAYALVDYMFDRELMTLCSWGGGTKGEPKHCFKAFTNTINLFMKVVHQYDKTFTRPICEEFFKKIMRHAVKRNAAKRDRSSSTKTKKNKREAEKQLQVNRAEPSNENPTQ